MIESRYLDRDAALKLLTNNWENNRTVHRGQKDIHVKDLAAKIAQGRWVVDAMEVPLLIDTNGTLYNGQNRCRAIVLANQGVVVKVRIEAPERCVQLYPTLDLGKGRDIADITGLHKRAVVQPIHYLMRCSGLEDRLKDESIVSRIADTYIGDILKHFGDNCSWKKHNQCFNTAQFKAALAYCVHQRIIADYDAVEVLEMLQTQREHMWTPMFRIYREQIMFPTNAGRMNNNHKTVANDRFYRAVYAIQKRTKSQRRIQVSAAYLDKLAVSVRSAIRKAAQV